MIKLKSLIFYIRSITLFYIGDWTCKLLHSKLFFNSDNKFTEWLADFYQWCMIKSLELDTDYKVWKVPEAKKIPKGPYCYDKNGSCPYYIHSHNHDDMCSYLQMDIMDEVKECDINKDYLK